MLFCIDLIVRVTNQLYSGCIYIVGQLMNRFTSHQITVYPSNQQDITTVYNRNQLIKQYELDFRLQKLSIDLTEQKEEEGRKR